MIVVMSNSAKPPEPQATADYKRFISSHYDGLAGSLTRVTGFITGHEALAGRLIRPEAFDVRGCKSILDAACRAGIELPFSCKAGVCSTCRTKLVRGKVQMVENYALEDWELEQGFILACQSHATTPEIELTYDET